jgi:hypothetical protein
VAVKSMGFGAGSVGPGGSGTLSGNVSAALGSTPQNNVSPGSGFPTGINRVKFNPDSAGTTVVVTGLVAGTDGQICLITNSGATQSLTLSYQDAGSTAANRFYGSGSSRTVAPGSTVMCEYDGSISNWVVVS